MGLDMSHGCWHGGYISFHYFRKLLMRIAGYPALDLMEGFYGYDNGSSDGLRDPLCLVQFAVDAKEGMARDVLAEMRRDLPIRWDALRPEGAARGLAPDGCHLPRVRAHGGGGMRTYEYGLHVWGGYFETAGALARAHHPGVYFFPTREARDAWLAEMSAAALASSVCQGMASTVFEGEDARDRTIACLTLVVGDAEYPMEYDFGFGFDEAGACYMFEDGNYACDCNRSLFLRRLYGDVPGLPAANEEMRLGDFVPSECGDTIRMKDFRVRRERGAAGAFVENPLGERLPPVNA
jgi:hypothetical protein